MSEIANDLKCMTFSKNDISRIEKEAYNKALEDLQERIDKEYCDGGYGDYHEVAMIVRMIEQMKGSTK